MLLNRSYCDGNKRASPIVLKAALQIPLLSLPVAGGWGGGGTVGLLRGLGTGLGRGSDPDWNTGGAVGLGLS